MTDPVEPHGYPERPSTSMSDGIGEEGMMSFFHTHMQSILKPFAEHVEEIFKTVLEHSGNLHTLQAKTESNIGLLQQHATRMNGMQERQDKLMVQAEATRKMLEGTINEEGKKDEARSLRIERLDDTLCQLQRAIGELQKQGEDTCTKLAKLQDKEDETREHCNQLKGQLGQVAMNLEETDKAHAITVETMNKNKILLDAQIKEQEEFAREQKAQNERQDNLNKYCAKNLKELDEKIAETQRQLMQCRTEFQQVNDATAKLISENQEEQNTMNEKIWKNLNTTNMELTKQTARIAEHTIRTEKLLANQDQRQSADMSVFRNFLEDLDALTSKHERQVAALQTATGAYPGQTTKNRVDIVEEDAKLSNKRNLRLEKVLKLEEMTKENMDDDKPRVTLAHGTLLTDTQMAEFQAAFSGFDTDGSGNVNAQEVGQILQSLNINVNTEIIKLIMREFDTDRSGEVNFEEFCGMMAKMLGPDGKVDVDTYMKNISETAIREAKQNEIVEIFPTMQEEVKKHQNLIELEQSKLHGTTDRVQKLEGNHLDLLKEVEMLRKSLDMNTAHWKGMTRGLKETKKTVHHEGESEMLQGAMRIRRELPPLGSLVNQLAAGTRPNTTPGSYSNGSAIPGFGAGEFSFLALRDVAEAEQQ